MSSRLVVVIFKNLVNEMLALTDCVFEHFWMINFINLKIINLLFQSEAFTWIDHRFTDTQNSISLKFKFYYQIYFLISYVNFYCYIGYQIWTLTVAVFIKEGKTKKGKSITLFHILAKFISKKYKNLNM